MHGRQGGENYYHGGRRDLEVGNTPVLADMIKDQIDCEVHRIEPADPCPQGYDETVARNRDEQNADARPGIAQAPMIMSTFTDAFDFTGKTIHPIVTYAVSGLSGVDEDYGNSCPGARIGAALAIRGEEAASSQDVVTSWLRRIELLADRPSTSPHIPTKEKT